MSCKIVARILGGLGNQLFCYAAARRLALINNAELVLDNISGFKRDFEYQRHYQLDHFNIHCRKASAHERMEPAPRIRRFLKRYLNRRKAFEVRNYIQQEGVDFDDRLLHVKPTGTVYLEGYWQSEKYFKDVEAEIRNDLRIIPPHDVFNQTMAENIRNRLSVAVHVRFFDAPNEHGIDNAPGDYYLNALSYMEEHIPGAHYFVFSDHPDEIHNLIPLPGERITLVTQNQGDETAYADLWLMSQCKHFIIANSTFSWWGAWLSDYVDKYVLAPGYQKREGKMWWGFDGLIPDNWIKL